MSGSHVVWLAILIAINLGLVYIINNLIAGAQTIEWNNWYEQQEYGCGVNIIIIAFMFVSAITCVLVFVISP